MEKEERGNIMEENTNTPTKKSGGMKKGLIGIIIAVILLVGGGVAAYKLLWDGSPKNRYFAAEKASYELIKDTFEDRFKNQLEWNEMSQKDPTESTVDLTANINSALVDPEIANVINSAKLSFLAQVDFKEQQINSEFSANVAGINLEDFGVSVDKNSLYIHLPFLDDVLKITDSDLNEILSEIDPYTFDETMEISFEDIFTQTDILSEENQKYIEKEYINYIFDEIPEDAFTAEKEKVDVLDETISAEKIEFHLSEKEFVGLLEKVVKKMQKDKELKNIIKEIMTTAYGMNSGVMMDSIMDEYDYVLEEIEDSLQYIELPKGVTSTIWVDKNLVVKREFTFDVADEGSITISGEQILTKEVQAFDYEIAVEDDYGGGAINLTGEFSNKKGEIEDSVKISLPDEFVLKYEADETSDKGKHDFNRVISLDIAGYGVAGSLVWEGTTNYEKDQMNGEHSISLNVEEFGGELGSVTFAFTGEKIKAVDMPDEANVVDIGKMSDAELQQYIQGDVAEKFFNWVSQFGFGGFTPGGF